MRQLAPSRRAYRRQRERDGDAATVGHAATGAHQVPQDASAWRPVAFGRGAVYLMRWAVRARIVSGRGRVALVAAAVALVAVRPGLDRAVLVSPVV